MNLAHTLHYAAERTPAAEALIDGELRITYSQLRDRAARLAGGLRALGVSPGDSVATLLKNRHENVEVFWACQWLGARFAPLSWRNAPSAIEYCVEDAGADVIVFEPASEELARLFEGQGKVLVASAGSSGDESYDGLIASEPIEGAFVLPDTEAAIILYTSGTTGRPKGVARSHRAERAAAMSQVLQHGYQPWERTLGVMPLYHTMGDHSMIAMSLVAGCYICQPDWDAAYGLDQIEGERISSLYMAPTLFHDITSHPGVSDRDLSSIRALGYAGAAMTGALVDRCTSTFNPQVFVNHYGSTEIYTYTIGRRQAEKPGNAGLASVNALIRLVRVDDEARPDEMVSQGEHGQIICHMSSPEAFTGYWKRPDADGRSIRDGWFYTGDLGVIDDEGDMWIVGRADDMINSGGENIHPLEVEDVLARAPGVVEVAVYGVPDERLGQRVVASVVAQPGVDAETLDTFCLTSPDLARYKRPREYRMTDSLPRSASGKILRRILRDGDMT
ncbi:MAG: AMP-binding protein [Actinomycetia bacterium]|nr:AMP-binding protein [Actinomycetes bacterium]